VLVFVGEEKGYWEYFEEGGGVSTMPVRTKAEMLNEKT